jgi:hypothetical protein
MSKRPKELLFIGGQTGPKGMSRILDLKMGDELAGCEVIYIMWYHKYRCFIITESKKHWNIHHYVSDTKEVRYFKDKAYPNNLYTYKILSKANIELKELLIKLVSKIKSI